MLFDLRGKGRRRTVRVIYIGLALLMGVGLVGFGIGGGFGGGGLLNAASNNEGSNAASFANQIKKYTKITKREPNNGQAWEKLTEAQLHEAGGEAYVTSTGGVTGKGKELFSRASQSWNSYLALNPAKPSAKLAQLVLPIYAPGGLDQPSQAVAALQIIVAAKPNSASRYAELAEYSYKAKNPRVGDLAAAKAVALAPANQRVRLKKELEEFKKNPSGEKVYTTTTNGKVYTGKLNSKGEIQATQVTTTPAPAKTTTTKK
jgi:hypothetical protein